MATFRDCKGDMWSLVVDIPAVKRVRSFANVDLLNVAISDKQTGVFHALSDPVTFAEVVYALCKPEAIERGLSDEEFARRLDIDTEELAYTIAEEIADFFRRRNQTKAAELVLWQIRKAKEAAAKIRAEVTDETMAALDRTFDVELEKAISRLRNVSGDTSSDSEELQASIRTNQA